MLTDRGPAGRRRRWCCSGASGPDAARAWTVHGRASPSRSASYRRTTRLAPTAENGRSQAEVGARSGVLADVQRAIIAHAQLELVQPEPTPVLGLDGIAGPRLAARLGQQKRRTVGAGVCGAVLGLVSGDDR